MYTCRKSRLKDDVRVQKALIVFSRALTRAHIYKLSSTDVSKVLISGFAPLVAVNHSAESKQKAKASPLQHASESSVPQRRNRQSCERLLDNNADTGLDRKKTERKKNAKRK